MAAVRAMPELDALTPMEAPITPTAIERVICPRSTTMAAAHPVRSPKASTTRSAANPPSDAHTP